MRVNPVYKRESTAASRTYRMAIVLLLFNGILAAVALLNMYSVADQVKRTAEVRYSSFLEIYIFVSAIEFVLLLLIMPALTSNAISGERERQTLELMLTTRMTPFEIVAGKLMAAFTTMTVLMISSLPVLALVFVYGGVNGYDVAMLLFYFCVTAIFTGSLGICFSAILKKSTLASVVTYVALLVLVAGTYAINTFYLSMANSRISQAMYYGSGGPSQPSAGITVYLTLFNPAVTFYYIINEQAGTNLVLEKMGERFGQMPVNWITGHWVECSVAAQLLVAAVFIFVAVRAIKPLKKRN